ncbi:hypothetical protein [Corynebacterium sp. TAE3-ERU16]|uniref:hypothetical protein n=1 Tax=Corynebacterium sp. TAE3-ERU16 TaxID=2849493 RepID=UPI001C46722A|nr:hypothetical protein [Corynebacterium sp. TAE3-ERU16]MBV7292361.1 hypothetical protein [Corynebacterium sp. TAE3-ERU16]
MTITVTVHSPHGGPDITRRFRDYTPPDGPTRTAAEQADAYEQARHAAGYTTTRGTE